MASDLATRIRRRMMAMNLNPTSLDKLAGLAIGFTRDFLEGRKAQPRKASLEKMAQALDCDIEYLTLQQRSPRHNGPAEDGPLLVGVAKPGVWRSVIDLDDEIVPTPFEADPRFDPDTQVAFSVSGNHASSFGVPEDTYLICLRGDSLGAANDVGVRDGDLAVIGCWREDLVEYSVAKVRLVNGKMEAHRATSKPGAMEVVREFTVEGLILTSIKHFR